MSRAQAARGGWKEPGNHLGGHERLWERGKEAGLLPCQWDPTKGSPPGLPGAALS